MTTGLGIVIMLDHAIANNPHSLRLQCQLILTPPPIVHELWHNIRNGVQRTIETIFQMVQIKSNQIRFYDIIMEIEYHRSQA